MPIYTPGFHPGSVLLPPGELIKYDNLPKSITDQINFDGSAYDLYGKMSAAFEDGLIDGPTGKAARDYEAWLKENPEIATEIDTVIQDNIKAIQTRQQERN